MQQFRYPIVLCVWMCACVVFFFRQLKFALTDLSSSKSLSPSSCITLNTIYSRGELLRNSSFEIKIIPLAKFVVSFKKKEPPRQGELTSYIYRFIF